MTLVELLVVLAILGLLAGVASVSMTAVSDREPPLWQQAIAKARRTALATGASVSVSLEIDGGTVAVTALPDGSIVTDGAVRIDRLAGRLETSPVSEGAR